MKVVINHERETGDTNLPMLNKKLSQGSAEGAQAEAEEIKVTEGADRGSTPKNELMVERCSVQAIIGAVATEDRCFCVEFQRLSGSASLYHETVNRILNSDELQKNRC